MEMIRLKPQYKDVQAKFELYADLHEKLAAPVVARIEATGLRVRCSLSFAWATVTIFDPNQTQPIGESKGMNDLDWHCEEAYLLARETLINQGKCRMDVRQPAVYAYPENYTGSGVLVWDSRIVGSFSNLDGLNREAGFDALVNGKAYRGECVTGQCFARANPHYGHLGYGVYLTLA